MRLPLIYTFCSFGFDTFATHNLEVVSFSFHPNDLARYIINKRTSHRLLKYHDKIDQWQILITPFPMEHISRLCGRMEKDTKRKPWS